MYMCHLIYVLLGSNKAESQPAYGQNFPLQAGSSTKLLSKTSYHSLLLSGATWRARPDLVMTIGFCVHPAQRDTRSIPIKISSWW